MKFGLSYHRYFYQLLIAAFTTICFLYPQLVSAKTNTEPNPHWDKNACNSYKTKNSSTAQNRNLNTRASEKICKDCHKEMDQHNSLHVFDINASSNMLNIMPKKIKASLNQPGNRITCFSCHDISLQCKEELLSERNTNPAFIRGFVAGKRSASCYQCHDKKAYQRLNPHDQISNQGEIYKNKCLLCHKNIPEQVEGVKTTGILLQVKSNWEKLCKNCHRVPFHPGGGTNHIVKPRSQTLAYLKKVSAKNNINLPLEPKTGRIYCATCHNPHERGIIKNEMGAKGADEKHRLRSKYICENCHDI